MNMSHMATRNYMLVRKLMLSLLIYIVKLCCFIADVQLLILECTVSWQPIRRERPPPRLLSVSGVSVSFLLISFIFLFWWVIFSDLLCLLFHVGPQGGGELSHLPGQGKMELVFGWRPGLKLPYLRSWAINICSVPGAKSW